MLRSRRENHPGSSSVGDERTNSRLHRNKTSKDRTARRDESPELLCSKNHSCWSDSNCSAFAEPVGASETVDLFHQKMELSCDQKTVWVAELSTGAGQHLLLTGPSAVYVAEGRRRPEAHRSGFTTSGVFRGL